MDIDGCIDLSNEIYSRDADPLLPGCQCLSCADNRYTKAYVHHLIKANEMLAQILLFGHNLHQILVLFREISRASSEGANKVEQLCSIIESQI
jgi:tRNA-guanine family transglycosylase